MAGTSRREDGIMVQSEDDDVRYFYFSKGKFIHDRILLINQWRQQTNLGCLQTLIIKMLEGWEIRQPVYLHRIRDTRRGYAITQWRINFSHSMKIYLHFSRTGKCNPFASI